VRATDSSETATGNFKSDQAYTQYDWDFSITGTSKRFVAGDDLPLTATPRIFVAEE
jgi:hypothetical protein